MVDAPPPYPELGRELTRLASAANLNKTELAAASYISTSYASVLLNGNRHPSLLVLSNVAEALGADFDALAKIAGYSVPDLGADRPYLPGWGSLREADKAMVRRQVRVLADLNAQVSASREARRPAQPEMLRDPAPAAPPKPQARSNRASRAAGQP